MKNIFKIIAFVAICYASTLFSQSYGSSDPIDNVREDSSMETPVVLKGLKGMYQVRDKEAEYVQARYEGNGYEPVDRGLLYLNKNGRIIHAVLYKNAKEEHLGIFYDITTAVSKFRKTNPKEHKRLLETLKEGGMSSEILDK